jgi:hypothetical protein
MIGCDQWLAAGKDLLRLFVARVGRIRDCVPDRGIDEKTYTAI